MKLEELQANEGAGMTELRMTLMEIANNISRSINGHWSVEPDIRAVEPFCAYRINANETGYELCRFYPFLDADGELLISINSTRVNLKCRYEKNLVSAMYDIIIKSVLPAKAV
ncbi:hypothetical protein [Oribacterium sp. WCC10]|uniref:hypothetical protein n=1 Tax=Oribacterium sp. WCC10 TaxID=1855343 RepID=UPI0008EDDB4C|nr:hypothetical protein [Oribacterium sp. WCC10]SFG09205.1 hypothetical protein SAMN05216356_101209 [Oribacterium sp. WCC10]